MEREDICACHVVHTDAVEAAKNAMMSEKDIQSLSTLFKIIGDPTRTKIVLALDNRELCGCDLTELLGMTKSAISHQMRILKENKIVKFRKDGKNVFYSLDDQHITDIIELATEHMRHSRRE